MADQVESVDFAYLEFSNAFDLVCHRLLAKKVVAMGIHFKQNYRGKRYQRAEL